MPAKLHVGIKWLVEDNDGTSHEFYGIDDALRFCVANYYDPRIRIKPKPYCLRPGGIDWDRELYFIIKGMNGGVL